MIITTSSARCRWPPRPPDPAGRTGGAASFGRCRPARRCCCPELLLPRCSPSRSSSCSTRPRASRCSDPGLARGPPGGMRVVYGYVVDLLMAHVRRSPRSEPSCRGWSAPFPPCGSARRSTAPAAWRSVTCWLPRWWRARSSPSTPTVWASILRAIAGARSPRRRGRRGESLAAPRLAAAGPARGAVLIGGAVISVVYGCVGLGRAQLRSFAAMARGQRRLAAAA